MSSSKSTPTVFLDSAKPTRCETCLTTGSWVADTLKATYSASLPRPQIKTIAEAVNDEFGVNTCQSNIRRHLKMCCPDEWALWDNEGALQ